MFFVSMKSKLFSKRNKEGESKENRRTLLYVIAVCVVVLLILFGWMAYASLHIPSHAYCEGVGKYSLQAETVQDRADFFAQFGYKSRKVESCEVTIPSSGEVLREYNEIQKSHGMNILPYGDKRARFYVYELKRGEEQLYGFMTVYKDRVVAVHISDCEYPSEVTSIKDHIYPDK